MIFVGVTYAWWSMAGAATCELQEQQGVSCRSSNGPRCRLSNSGLGKCVAGAPLHPSLRLHTLKTAAVPLKMGTETRLVGCQMFEAIKTVAEGLALALGNADSFKRIGTL